MTTSVPAIRLARALGLSVQPLDGGAYRVTGGRSPHRVETISKAWSCDCSFASFRPPPCKHVLAVYLSRQLGEPVLNALRGAVRPALLEAPFRPPRGKPSRIPPEVRSPLDPDRPARPQLQGTSEHYARTRAREGRPQ